MTLHLYCEVNPAFSFHYKKLASRIVKAVLVAEHFSYDMEVSLTIVDDALMREINREQRAIDASTDVLSFPMLTFPAPADYSKLDAQLSDSINPETGEVVLGDIVLSADKVREQALAFGHSEKREYAFLLTHSMLHLLGYDHIDPDDEELMLKRQRMILNSLGIYR